MNRSLRTRLGRSSIAAVAALACLVGTPASSGGAAPAPGAARGGGTGLAAGLAGSPITLASNSQVSGYDIAMDANGTAYVGWIASSGGGARTVYSCVLPQGATACLNGVQSTASLGAASAAGLQVVAPVNTTGTLMVWFHDTADSVIEPFGGRVAYATVGSNGALSAANDTPVLAPSNGALLAAERAADGNIWTVQQEASPDGDALRVVTALDGAVHTLDPPWLVGKARLTFAGGKAVIVASKLGGFGEALRVVRQTDTGWSSFNAVSGTWSTGGTFDVATQGGARLVAPVNNATYYPRIANWSGTQFGSFARTGSKNSCPRYSHDLFPDPSGRLADVTFECNQIAIANHPKARTAAFVRIGAGGTPTDTAHGPQIATYARGLGWVAWARVDGDNERLLVAPIRLPAQKTSKTVSSIAGKVTVTGPVSCLPAVQTTIGVSAKGLNGWSVVSKTLKLDGSVHGTGLNGAGLSPGSSHTVAGTVKFKKGGQTKTVTAQLGFTSCPSI